MRIIKIVLLVMISCSLLKAQVNTEALRKFKVSPGLHNKANFSISYQSGNTNLYKIKTGLRSDYLRGEYHFFGVLDYQQGEKDDRRYTNKGFIHLRGQKTLNNKVAAESFLQKEYDEFIMLSDRNLAGTGLRFTILQKKPAGNDAQELKTYLGTGIMFENESYNDDIEPEKSLIRTTNYLGLFWKKDERVRFQLISYFQAAFEDFSDYRILSEGNISFTINSRLSIAVMINHRYDNNPPGEVKNSDLEISNGLEFLF
ncbi:MAG: DUF481 domain-containing protein [Calditrichaceae bacterium]